MPFTSCQTNRTYDQNEIVSKPFENPLAIIGTNNCIVTWRLNFHFAKLSDACVL